MTLNPQFVCAVSVTVLLNRLHGAPVHFQLGMEAVRGLPVAFLAFGVGMVHVCAMAGIARRILNVRFPSPIGETLYLALGYALFGFYLWLIGYFHLLSSWALCISALAFASALRPSTWWRAAAWTLERTRAAASAHRGLAIAISAVIGLAIVAGLRGTQFDDDYRWQSAMVWADAKTWVRTPYRLTNGTSMSEMFHLVGAVFGSVTAAHWMSTALWLICACGVAAIASTFEVSAVVAIAAAVSIPVFTAMAPVLNSDVTSAAFAVSALAFLVCSSPRNIRAAALAAGLLLAAVFSTKFVVIAIVPACLFVVIRRSDNCPDRIRLVGRLVLPTMIVATLWACHTYRLIGHPFDNSGKYLARTPDDLMWKLGWAAGRVPRPQDLLRLPLEPFIAIVYGQREPYGGRDGLLWALFTPVALALAYLRLPNKNAVLGTFFAAVSFFVLLGPMVLKTRFLFVSFLLLGAVAALAFEKRNLIGGRLAKAVAVVFVLAFAFGALDGSRKLLVGMILDVPPSPAMP